MLDSNRVAVIASANGVTGRAAVKLFAKAELRPARSSRSDAHVAQVASELHLPSNMTLTKGLNFREPGAAATAAYLTAEKSGCADMLIHLIGGWAGSPPLAEMERCALEEML